MTLKTSKLPRLVATLAMLAVPFLLGGCSGAYWGNLIVLGVSVGIFYGTLSLGRTPTRTQPEGSVLSQRPPAASADPLAATAPGVAVSASPEQRARV